MYILCYSGLTMSHFVSKIWCRTHLSYCSPPQHLAHRELAGRQCGESLFLHGHEHIDLLLCPYWWCCSVSCWWSWWQIVEDLVSWNPASPLLLFLPQPHAHCLLADQWRKEDLRLCFREHEHVDLLLVAGKTNLGDVLQWQHYIFANPTSINWPRFHWNFCLSRTLHGCPWWFHTELLRLWSTTSCCQSRCPWWHSRIHLPYQVRTRPASVQS